jgi:hypothetical protein
MRSEPFVLEFRTSTRRHWPLKRSSSQSASHPAGLHLASIDRSVDVTDALARPPVAKLMTEDFFWRCALTAWRSRRPPLWRRTQRAAWRAEGAVLGLQRSRIRERATELGIPLPSRVRSYRHCLTGS